MELIVPVGDGHHGSVTIVVVVFSIVHSHGD
jgi:hypothetical protein